MSKFTRLFVKDEETTVEEKPITQTPTKTSSPTFISPTNYSSVGTGVADPEIKADLEKVLSDSNFPGEDYYDLREATKNLITSAGLDPNTALKAAFATLSSNNRGLSKAKALETAGQYIDIINKEKDNFLSAVASRTDQKVSVPTKEIASLQSDNANFAKQIEDITKKMTENNDTISKKKGEIAEQQSIIERSKTNWEFTHAQFVKEIEDDIKKIQLVIA